MISIRLRFGDGADKTRAMLYITGMNKRELKDSPVRPPFWIISDTHFGHDNIIKYCGRPQEHEQLMLDAWHQRIGPDDVVLHLGDLLLDRRGDIAPKVAKLPGKKFLLKGNHDRRSSKYYQGLGFRLIRQSFALPYMGWQVVFSHRPDYDKDFICYPKHLNVHGHIHQRLLDDRCYLNVSVEHTDYKPLLITELLDQRIAELS